MEKRKRWSCRVYWNMKGRVRVRIFGRGCMEYSRRGSVLSQGFDVEYLGGYRDAKAGDLQ